MSFCWGKFVSFVLFTRLLMISLLIAASHSFPRCQFGVILFIAHPGVLRDKNEGEILSCDTEFEEGGVGGAGLLVKKKEKLLCLNFRGLFCICFLTLGTFLPAEESRGWEGRAGGASSGCSPSCLISHREPSALGAHPCRVWDALHQLQQQLQPHIPCRAGSE